MSRCSFANTGVAIFSLSPLRKNSKANPSDRTSKISFNVMPKFWEMLTKDAIAQHKKRQSLARYFLTNLLNLWSGKHVELIIAGLLFEKKSGIDASHKMSHVTWFSSPTHKHARKGFPERSVASAWSNISDPNSALVSYSKLSPQFRLVLDLMNDKLQDRWVESNTLTHILNTIPRVLYTKLVMQFLTGFSTEHVGRYCGLSQSCITFSDDTTSTLMQITPELMGSINMIFSPCNLPNLITSSPKKYFETRRNNARDVPKPQFFDDLYFIEKNKQSWNWR